MKLWQRYLIAEFLKVFALFLFGFYFLYVAIDYCAHMQDFVQDSHISLQAVAFYYGLQFIKRSDILLPVALLVSQLKLLLSWNAHRELVAFQSAGLSWKRLVTPLLLIATLLTLCNLAIAQWALPSALRKIDRFHDAHLRHSHRGNRLEPIHVLHLEDQSKLIYQSYDSVRARFVDVVWVRSPHELWKMKSLSATPESPVAYFADHLEKNSAGYFEKRSSYEEVLLSDLKWETQVTRRGFIPYENRSISELLQFLNRDIAKYSTHEVKTQLLHKLLMPLLCLLVPIAVTPFCVRYGRSIPFFFYYSLSLFALIAFIAFLDAAVILGESATLSPYIALLGPFLLLGGYFCLRFWKRPSRIQTTCT